MAHGKSWAVTSLILLACCFASAQVPTPIRSVSSLPATCKGGSSTQSSDMVVLITAGVGTNYLCTATNTWTQVAGGTGSPPGGPSGSIQYNSGVGVFGGNIAEVNATAFAGADICAQITAAMAALPADGGTVIVPGGNWPACADPGSGIAINITKHIILRGVGSADAASASGPTTINIAAGVTGIDINGGTADKSSVRDLYLLSASAGAGTDDGIRIRAVSVVIKGVTVSHFGRTGVRVDGGNTGGNADLWHLEDVESGNNFGDGFRLVAPCTDNNVGTGLQLNAFVNGGWGYYIDCGGGNSWMTTHATQNVLGGVFVNSSWQNFYNAYVELGVGSSFVIAAGLQGVNANFQAFGQPTTITNPGATQDNNHIQYFGAQGWQVQAGILLGGQPGTASNKTYMLRVFGTVNGDLDLFDYTDGLTVFNFDPVGNTKFNFGQRLTTTSSGILPAFNLGNVAGDPATLINGDMWYDTVSNKFRCFENGGSTDCIGGGGSVTHTAGPLTAGQIAIGNGAADLTVDPSASTDGAGNVVGVSFQTSGVNGGFTGVEGTGAGLTAGAGLDLLFPDSTSHCWHQNLNNVDSGCSMAAYTSGGGFGTVFGAPAVFHINQTSNTPWSLAITNSGSTNGLAAWVDNTGIASFQNLDNAGSVKSEIQLKPNGDVLLAGNGGANMTFTIPTGAAPDFVFANGSGGAITGSPKLKLNGVTSGSAAISVASAALTPNTILLPTTTGTSGQVWQTDGANPQQTSWVTDIKSYNHSGTLQTVSHLVQDSCVLGTSCAVTLTSTAVYTNSTSYTCICQDDTAIAACSVAQSSGSAFTITGTGTDTIRYSCIGN